MPRPAQRTRRLPLTPAEIGAASYVGSAEHKVSRWWGGLPKARENAEGLADRPKRQRTSICRKVGEADRDQATVWVRSALAAGQVRFTDGDKTYPKHIRYKDEKEQFWFGFAVNGVAGTYKGWPIDEAEKREAFD